jgi:hypothetical protein
MAAVWATLMQGCVGGLLDGVRRVVDEAPCPCRARRAPVDPRAPAPIETDPAPATDADGPGAESAPEPFDLGDHEPVPGADLGQAALVHHLPLEGDGELPPAPWRWRWVWATPGRPSGMALVAADGTLVLWSPGGFAPPGAPPDGRPTADVANALANLPHLATSAADADTLRSELERARAVADETRRLLNRAAGAVDDEIGRVNGPEVAEQIEPGEAPPER